MPRLPLRILLPCLALVLAACGSPEDRERGEGSVGPVLGHVDARRALVWYRPAQPGPHVLEVRRADGEGPPLRLRADSRSDHDGTVLWSVEPLAPGTAYRYAIRNEDTLLVTGESLHTAPAPGVGARVRLAIGSCASLEDHPIWTRMRTVGADAVVLLGDTPYIDATGLATARARHRAFLRVPALADTVRRIPLWSTWDDHDYGKDNADGRLVGKAATRRAYMEYRAQVAYGRDGEGIYTRVRYGPVEVFLLDGRWFAGLEPAVADPAEPSCLGRGQWNWLVEALRASDAPVKVLASGMVWHDKGGRSQDDWATYAAERDALFAVLGTSRIDGCVLLSGDVHASQHLVYEGTAAGYPLHEMVTSPLHGRAWRGGDRRIPARRWGAVEKHVFLLLEVDTAAAEPALTGSWIRADGKELHRVRVLLSALTPPANDPAR